MDFAEGALSPGRLGDHAEDQADRPGADHQHRVADVQIGPAADVCAHGERLAQGGQAVAEPVGHADHLAAVHADPLGERAVGVDAQQTQGAANVPMAHAAGLAAAATDQGLGDHAIADGEAGFRARPDRLDDSHELVALNDWRLGRGVMAQIDVDVGATDAGIKGPHQALTGGRLGHRQVLDLDLLPLRGDGGFHGLWS